MQCPVCNVQLAITERQGIEIDYCPQCRGVWLDRGELDKIIDRAATETRPAAQPEVPQQVWAQPQPQRPPVPQSPPQPYYRGDDDDDDYRHHHKGYKHGHKRHKRGGFLGELFDFD